MTEKLYEELHKISNNLRFVEIADLREKLLGIKKESEKKEEKLLHTQNFKIKTSSLKFKRLGVKK